MPGVGRLRPHHHHLYGPLFFFSVFFSPFYSGSLPSKLAEPSSLPREVDGLLQAREGGRAHVAVNFSDWKR